MRLIVKLLRGLWLTYCGFAFFMLILSVGELSDPQRYDSFIYGIPTYICYAPAALYFLLCIGKQFATGKVKIHLKI